MMMMLVVKAIFNKLENQLKKTTIDNDDDDVSG